MQQPPTRLDQIELVLPRIAQQQETNTQAIAALEQRISDGFDDVVNKIVTLAESAEADRQAFQAESRQIWQYLLQQKPSNGRGE